MPCAFPHSIWNPKAKLAISAPCRKCMCCRLKAAQDIQQLAEFYLYTAYKRGLGASFVTLTHNDGSLPLSLDTGLPSLSYKLFKDRINYAQKTCVKQFGTSFKYVAAGEYGDNPTSEDGRRPHYHVAVLGLDPSASEIIFRSVWNHDEFGIADIGALQPGGLRYVCKYLEKQIKGGAVENVYSEMDVEMPFVVHSQNLDKEFVTSVLDDFSAYGDLRSFYGVSRPVSRYLRDKYNLKDSTYNLAVREHLAVEAANAHQSVNEYLRESALIKERTLIHESLAKGNPVDKSAFESGKQVPRVDSKSLAYLASIDVDKLYRDINDPIPF